VSSNGSGDFGLHTECPHLDCPPDYFLLFCLRGDPKAQSPFVHIDDMLGYLPPKIVEILRKPIFKIVSGASYETKTERLVPVFYSDPNTGRLAFRYHAHNLTATTDEGFRALATFASISLEVTTWDCMSAGDLVIFNNRRVLHGRSSFSPVYDGGQRWLQRVYLARNIDSYPQVKDRLWVVSGN
jgi:L-asparagine oxygenase